MLLTNRDLARRWGIHYRTVPAAAARIGLQPIRFSARTIRYCPKAVAEAEANPTRRKARFAV